MAFPSTPILDEFNRSDEAVLASPWTTASTWWGTGLDLAGNNVGGVGGFSNGSTWGTQFGPNFEVYVTVAVLPTTVGDGFGITMSPDDLAGATPIDAFDLYVDLEAAGTFLLRLFPYVDDVIGTSICGATGVTLTAGSVVGVRHAGTTFYIYVDGVLVASGSDSSSEVVMNIALATYEGDVRLDSFGGGTITSVHNRFYPTVIAPHRGRLDGAMKGSWDDGFYVDGWDEPQLAYLSRPIKDSGGQKREAIFKTNQQGDFDIAMLSYWIGPLNAQTISGTFNACFRVMARWLSPSPTSPSEDTLATYKFHIYITQGYSTAVRHVLVDNAVDPNNFPGPFDFAGSPAWLQPSVAPPITSGAALDGDYVRVEIGIRLRESPIETPQYFPDETWASEVTMGGLSGTTTSGNVNHPDATPGTTTLNASGWFEFSGGLDIQSDVVAAPDNDACADAVAISALPYASPRIDTSASAGTQREVWYKLTAPTDGRIFLTAFGSTYNARFDVFSGGCGVLTVVGMRQSISWAIQRNTTVCQFTATAATEYHIRIRNVTSTGNAVDSGGSLTIQAFYRETPAEDDLYLPCGVIAAFRDGVMVNATPLFNGSAPTGVVIDYSQLPMDDLNGGTNTDERLLVGLHHSSLVEILELGDLSFGDFQAEVDFIGDPIDDPVAQVERHPATLALERSSNTLFIAHFGNGYLYVMGEGALTSDRPAVLNTVPNDPDRGAVRSLGVTEGDSQSGAPFTADYHYPSAEVTAPWAISLDESTRDLYFTSGGFYVPVGGQQVRKYNLDTAVTSIFASIPARSGNNPGLKGLQFLPGGGLLVCNMDVVHRLNSSGAIVSTYTPTLPLESQALGDVKLTADGTKFWVVDIPTAHLFLVDLATMTEVAEYETWMLPGALVQMAIYQPDGVAEPPEAGGGVEALLTDCPDSLIEDPPGKPLPKFLRTHGYLKQGPAASGAFDTDPAPGKGLGSRFKG